MTLARLPDDPQFGDADARIAYNRVFFALLRVDRSVMPGVASALREMGIADPIWYEILLATEEAGPGGIPMQALQKRLFVPQYALSRHIARIEKAGFVRRESIPGAGRGQRVFLAPAAEGLQERVWQVYMARIQAHLAPRLSTDEAYDLVRLLNRLYD
jgi:DNA-binding MarR family transcriptional regulator